jgi:hypothetical protein
MRWRKIDLLIALLRVREQNIQGHGLDLAKNRGARRHFIADLRVLGQQENNPRLSSMAVGSAWSELRLSSVLPMTQLLFGQQSEGYDDQAAASISRQRRVEAEEQPVCNGDEKHAQSE